MTGIGKYEERWFLALKYRFDSLDELQAQVPWIFETNNEHIIVQIYTCQSNSSTSYIQQLLLGESNHKLSEEFHIFVIVYT